MARTKKRFTDPEARAIWLAIDWVDGTIDWTPGTRRVLRRIREECRESLRRIKKKKE